MLSTVKIKSRADFRFYFIIFIVASHIRFADAANPLITILPGTGSIGTFFNTSCKVNSSSAAVWWTDGAVNVTNQRQLPSDNVTETILTFESLTLLDFKNYTCKVRLESGAVLNKTYPLYFNVDPIIEPAKPQWVIREFSNVTLSCAVKGYPITEEIKWDHPIPHQKLTSNENLKIDSSRVSLTEIKSKVVILNATAANNGTYYCVYSNKLMELPLAVKSKPSVRFDVLKAIGKSSVFANWTIVDGNAPVKRLTFKYKLSNATSSWIKLDIETKSTDYIWRNLTPSTLYIDFALEAENEVGNHTDMAGNATTLSEDPEFIPDVAVRGHSSTSVTLEWPVPNKLSEYYHYYNVTALNRKSGERSSPSRAYETTYLVEHLEPGTEYEFQVQACSEYTRLCYGESKAVNASTMDGMSSPPKNVNVDCNSSPNTRVRVTWERPDEPQGIITEYNVELSGNATFDDGSGRLSEDRIAPSTKSVVSPSVEFAPQPPNTNLFVSVCAKTRTKICGQLGRSSCTTPLSKPDKEELSKATWKLVHRTNSSTIYFMITLPHISHRNGSICCLRVIVVRMKKDEKISDLVPPDLINISTYDEVHNGSKGGAYVAEALETNGRTSNIMIGDETEEKPSPCHKCGVIDGVNQGSTGSFRRQHQFPTNAPERRIRHAANQVYSRENIYHFKDGPLDAGSTYTAYLDASVLGKHGTLRSQSRYFEPLKPSRYQETSPSIMPGIAVLGSLVLALIVVLMALTCVMRWRRKEPGSQEYGLSHSFQQWCRRLRGQQPIPSDEPPNLPPVPREQLVSAYVDRHKDSDYGFQQEFENLPDKFCDRTSTASDLRDNSGKNRYPDIKAYDQSRVKLLTNDGGSDYINANMVVGYKERKKFICAQGPMESTVVDWWRLIWEQHVHLILMLTNVEEYNKTKCAKYWPSEGSINYGDLVVTHYAEKRYSDYLVRSIKLSKNRPDANGHDEMGKEEREVTQYHYLVWKDFMAPEHPVGIIRFIKRFNEVYSLEKGPILVHCSAGVGRTGTLVALDSLLQQLAEEGCVSIFNTICDLRHQRNYLVQSLKQYIFIYRALMEMSQFGDTDVIISELKSSVEQLKAVPEGKEISKMQEEFERLAQVIEDRKPFSVGASEENRHRNRHETVIPYDRSRVILSPMPGPNKEICTYINASFIEGYDNSEQFIIAQDPMEATVGEFWRMIIEQNVRSVVMLSETGEEKCPRYWPEKDQETSHDYIKVKYMQSQSFPFYYRREFTVSNTKTEDSCLVTQFQYNGWPVGEGEVPQIDRGTVELIDTTFKHREMLEKSCGPMVVHCSDGADRSCIFVALTILIQQMKNEPRIDVFSAIRKLRSQRQGLFRNFAQYEFIYRGLVTHAELHVANGNAGH